MERRKSEGYSSLSLLVETDTPEGAAAAGAEAPAGWWHEEDQVERMRRGFLGEATYQPPVLATWLRGRLPFKPPHPLSAANSCA